MYEAGSYLAVQLSSRPFNWRRALNVQHGANAMALEWHKIYARVRRHRWRWRWQTLHMLSSHLKRISHWAADGAISFRMQLRQGLSSLLYYLLLTISLASSFFFLHSPAQLSFLIYFKSIENSKSELMRRQQTRRSMECPSTGNPH